MIDPWGKVVISAQEGEETIVVDLGMKFMQNNEINSIDNFHLNSLLYFNSFVDTSLVQKVREQIPVLKQRRLDLYDTLSKFDA